MGKGMVCGRRLIGQFVHRGVAGVAGPIRHSWPMARFAPAILTVTISGTRIAGWSLNPLIANAEAPTLVEMHCEPAVRVCCARGRTRGRYKQGQTSTVSTYQPNVARRCRSFLVPEFLHGAGQAQSNGLSAGLLHCCCCCRCCRLRLVHLQVVWWQSIGRSYHRKNEFDELSSGPLRLAEVEGFEFGDKRK